MVHHSQRNVSSEIFSILSFIPDNYGGPKKGMMNDERATVRLSSFLQNHFLTIHRRVLLADRMDMPGLTTSRLNSTSSSTDSLDNLVSSLGDDVNTHRIEISMIQIELLTLLHWRNILLCRDPCVNDGMINQRLPAVSNTKIGREVKLSFHSMTDRNFFQAIV